MSDSARSRASFPLLISLVLMCLSASVRLQTPQPTPSTTGLTFEQIYELAARDNLLVNAVRRRRAVAEAQLLIAGLRPNPDFISSYTRSEPRLQYSVSQLVELGGKRGRRIDVAKNELRLTELDVDAALRTLRHEVRAGYFNLALARNNYELGQQAVAQA